MQNKKEKDCLFPNFRDLGGFLTRDGKRSKKGVYFRSGMPGHLDEKEIAFLNHRGIKTVLDFRIDEERKRAGWYQKRQNGLDYVRLPYYDQDSVALIKEMEEKQSFDWLRIYTEVLKEGKNWIRDVFFALALSEDAVLFYCASGKDRTGVIAALLLDMLRAEDVWIVTDYCLTWYSLDHNKSSFFATSPKTMVMFLETIRNQYGSAEQYLVQAGVPVSLLQRIKERILI